jgi:hypothetical protein
VGGGSVKRARKLLKWRNEEGEAEGGEREGRDSEYSGGDVREGYVMRGEEGLKGESVEIGGHLRENEQISIIEDLAKK